MTQKRYVPLKKQSKKAQKAAAQKNRASWFGLNPVTRRPENPKAYKRKPFRYEENSSGETVF